MAMGDLHAVAKLIFQEIARPFENQFPTHGADPVRGRNQVGKQTEEQMKNAP
jgi:hypothetical protein